jgi:hypothetical protein
MCTLLQRIDGQSYICGFAVTHWYRLMDLFGL